MYFMILCHVSITSSEEVSVKSSLHMYHYTTDQNNITKKKKKKSKILKYNKRLHWITYWKILCMFLFFNVSKPLYGYYKYVTVMLFTLPTSVMW